MVGTRTQGVQRVAWVGLEDRDVQPGALRPISPWVPPSGFKACSGPGGEGSLRPGCWLALPVSPGRTPCRRPCTPAPWKHRVTALRTAAWTQGSLAGRPPPGRRPWGTPCGPLATPRGPPVSARESTPSGTAASPASHRPRAGRRRRPRTRPTRKSATSPAQPEAPRPKPAARWVASRTCAGPMVWAPRAFRTSPARQTSTGGPRRSREQGTAAQRLGRSRPRPWRLSQPRGHAGRRR